MREPFWPNSASQSGAGQRKGFGVLGTAAVEGSGVRTGVV